MSNDPIFTRHSTRLDDSIRYQEIFLVKVLPNRFVKILLTPMCVLRPARAVRYLDVIDCNVAIIRMITLSLESQAKIGFGFYVDPRQKPV